MSDATIVTVSDEMAGERADRVVAEAMGISRSQARLIFDTAGVSVAGEQIRPSQRLSAGVAVSVVVPVVARDLALNPEVRYEIAHEDGEVLIVDKPPGLVAHPGAGHADDTLLNGLVAHRPELVELGEARRYGLVHRLDRDTSGLLAVAKTEEMFDHLQELLRKRDVTRRYVALVVGAAPAATGTIDAPVARDPAAPTRMAIIATGRPARTHYRRTAVWEGATLLRVTLETGRTHQIRVHLASVGMPIAGDRTYGKVDHQTDPGRTFLHATELQFTRPDGSTTRIASPLPADLRVLVERLGPAEDGQVPPELL